MVPYSFLLSIDLSLSLHPPTARYLHITTLGIYVLMFVIWPNNDSESMETPAESAFLLLAWLGRSLVRNRKRARINMFQVAVNLLPYNSHVDIWLDSCV